MFVAGIIGDNGDAPLTPYPLIVCRDVVGRIAELHLTRHDRDADRGPMRLEVHAFIRMGRVGRVAEGQCESELDVDSGGLVVQIAKDALLLAGILGVDMRADSGLEVLGDLGAVAPQLALGVSAEMRP